MRLMVAILVLVFTHSQIGCTHANARHGARGIDGGSTVEVAYVVDGSKHMVRSFSDVRNAVTRAVMELSQNTTFVCIYAGAESIQQLGPLVSSRDAVNRVMSFLADVKPEAAGVADLGRAIVAARAFGAKAVWVVSDGTLALHEKAAKRALAAAATGGGSINTVLHFARTPRDRKFLFELALAGNGECVAEDGSSIRHPPEGYGSLPDVTLIRTSIFRGRETGGKRDCSEQSSAEEE